jgi:hypothetical protein
MLKVQTSFRGEIPELKVDSSLVNDVALRVYCFEFLR